MINRSSFHSVVTIQLLQLESMANLSVILGMANCELHPEFKANTQGVVLSESSQMSKYAEGKKTIDLAIVKVGLLGFPPSQVKLEDVCARAVKEGFLLPSWQMAVGLRMALTGKQSNAITPGILPLRRSRGVPVIFRIWDDMHEDETHRVLEAGAFYKTFRLHTELDLVALALPPIETKPPQ